MNNEQKREINQTLTLTNRKKLEVTGVKKIDSMNSEEFYIATNFTPLRIEGRNLEMQHLDIEKGVLWIGGTIDTITYLDDEKPKEKKTSFVGKLFK